MRGGETLAQYHLALWAGPSGAQAELLLGIATQNRIPFSGG